MTGFQDVANNKTEDASFAWMGEMGWTRFSEESSHVSDHGFDILLNESNVLLNLLNA